MPVGAFLSVPLQHLLAQDWVRNNSTLQVQELRWLQLLWPQGGWTTAMPHVRSQAVLQRTGLEPQEEVAPLSLSALLPSSLIFLLVS